jgi:hypothetical protein
MHDDRQHEPRPDKSDFLAAIADILQAALDAGQQSVQIRASDLHQLVGGYPGTAHRMPVCCSALRAAMRPGDQLIYAPPKSKSANLVIAYSLETRREAGYSEPAAKAERIPTPLTPERSPAVVPPATPIRSGRLSPGDQVVVYDYVLMGEVIGEIVEYRRGEAPMWRIRIPSDASFIDIFIDSEGTSHLGRWHVVRPADHPVDRFFRLASQVTPYPVGTEPVPARIVGTAFFPGGAGLWRESISQTMPPLPIRGVMVIGQDFHSRAKYRESARRGQEEMNDPTWRGLRGLLKDVGVSESDCYFTNAFVGLRNDGTVTGDYPGTRDEEFVRQCQSLLAEQIATQKPRVIVTLGLPAARMLTSLAPTPLRFWLGARNFVDIDGRASVIRNVRFSDIPDVSPNVTALVHPSMRNSNVARRVFCDSRGTKYEGAPAERAMLEDALGTSEHQSLR